jgi:hypothetical protein
MSDLDKAIIANVVRQLSGTCRHCGCHGDSCRKGDGDRCGWIDSMRTLCSADSCLIAEGKAKRKHKFATRRRTKGRADLSDEQLVRRVAKMNRRSERHELAKLLRRHLDGSTRWGKMARPSQIRAGAKLLAVRIQALGEAEAATKHLKARAA